MKKWKIYLCSVVFLILAGCNQTSGNESSGGSSSSKSAVKVGVVLPLTGPAALYGQQAQEGGKLAAKMINDNGGILGGRKIELIVEDDQAKPENGVNMFNKLINKDKVNAITGGVNSSVSIAEKDIAKNKLVSKASSTLNLSRRNRRSISTILTRRRA